MAPSESVAELALVTGASSGIGEAFARRLASEGSSLIVVARRGDRLSGLADDLRREHGTTTTCVVADLTRRAGLEAVRDAIGEQSVDLAVLNAGFGSTGALSSADADRQADMVRLNAVAVTDLAARVLPGMVERGRGDLIVVSSAAAFQPIPFMATYAATKAFELHFVRAVSAELRGTGVRASAVCPGPVWTEFGDAMDGDSLNPRLPHDSADDVAEAALSGLRRGRTMVPVGRIAAAASVARVVPAALSAAVVGRLHRLLRNRPRG